MFGTSTDLFAALRTVRTISIHNIITYGVSYDIISYVLYDMMYMMILMRSVSYHMIPHGTAVRYGIRTLMMYVKLVELTRA